MRIFNTLTKKLEQFEPLEKDRVRMYSCGPTVYDHIHIGNLSAFIYADTLRRALVSAGFSVTQVMNFTDVDDKTINRSQELLKGSEPMVALRELTQKYINIFLMDMKAIGNNLEEFKFIKATDYIEHMKKLIADLLDSKIAYVTDDGVYFSIKAYQQSGKKYGQLVKIDEQNTSEARIDNDEYDKDSVHDFALWKKQKPGEPAWEFNYQDHQLLGRPGWHIECSAMSAELLGLPFDIHTGGVDLIFPHHENEIAQSTATAGDVMASYFVHNEHLLVDGKKMSKSLKNFYTLKDVESKNIETMAFRLLALQSHYRSQSNFTWQSLEDAANRLKSWRNAAALRFQLIDDSLSNNKTGEMLNGHLKSLTEAIQDDLNTPEALAEVDMAFNRVANGITKTDQVAFDQLLKTIDELFGLNLQDVEDLPDESKKLIEEWDQLRLAKNFDQADKLREELKNKGIILRSTSYGPIWELA